MEMLRQSGTGRAGIVTAFAECAEKKIKNYGQWQAGNDGHKTCANRMPLDATRHEINHAAD